MSDLRPIPWASILRVAVLPVAALLAFAPATAGFAAASLSTANADLQAGKADEAIAILNEALQANPNDGEANNLLCRVEFSLEQFDQAAAHCEKAVQASPQNAVYHLWLGRAIGERASRASFMSAFSLAKKTRAEFETAVQLDPRLADALADLGEFDRDAPGAVGGGIDKAQAIAKQLDSVDAQRAHLLRGAIAEKEKDNTTAEQEFKAAASGPHAALGWTELAGFYRRQQRWPEMESAIQSAAAAAPHDHRSAIALFDGASALARANRNPQLAIQLFQQYLASSDKTEDAPAFDAWVRLAKLHAQAGDTAAAQHDKAAALALAHEYKPAQSLP